MCVFIILLTSFLLGTMAGTFFDINSQGITDVSLHPVPAGTENMRLQNNLISHIPPGYFATALTLTEIHAHQNKLSVIDKGMYK